MDVDIRVPIGLLFVVLGLILAVLGLATLNDPVTYSKSLGVNINLWTGAGMLAFGGIMLFFSLRKKKA